MLYITFIEKCIMPYLILSKAFKISRLACRFLIMVYHRVQNSFYKFEVIRVRPIFFLEPIHIFFMTARGQLYVS